MVGRIIKGVSWSAIEHIASQSVQFVISVVLARLLLPEDYGLVALALVIINILQIINETGFAAALIQKLDRDELDFSSVFVLNMVMGGSLYLLLFVSAPLLSLLFRNLELTTVTRWLGLNLIITSFVVVQRTKLIINVDFKTIAKASVVAVAISGIVGIWGAYHRWGVMALVVQSLLNNTINTLLVWLLVKWRPKLQFSWQRTKELFQYAYKLILSRLISVIFGEVYQFVIGVYYTTAQLGLFNRAKSFETLSSKNITNIVQRVSTPILCEEQSNHKQMSITLMSFICNTAMIVYPLLFGMMVLAEPLIVTLLTDKWTGAIWILRVICPVGLFYVISTFNRTIFNATGRTDWALKTEIIKKIIDVIILILAIIIGFEALVLSQVIIAIFECGVDMYYTQKQIGLKIMAQLKAILPVLLASIVMSLCVWLVSSLFDSAILKLVSGVLCGIIVYSGGCLLFNINNIRLRFHK